MLHKWSHTVFIMWLAFFAQYVPQSFMLIHVIYLFSLYFKRLYHKLSILLILMGTWFVSSFELLQTQLLWTFFLKYLLFLAILDISCCVQAFSSCSKQGHSSLWCISFSLQWLLFQWSMGFRCMDSVVAALRLYWAHQLWCMGFVAQQHMESSWTRDQTCVPYIGRQIPNHWTNR